MERFLNNTFEKMSRFANIHQNGEMFLKVQNDIYLRKLQLNIASACFKVRHFRVSLSSAETSN